MSSDNFGSALLLRRLQGLVAGASIGHIAIAIAVVGVMLLVIDYSRMLHLRSKMVGRHL